MEDNNTNNSSEELQEITELNDTVIPREVIINNRKNIKRTVERKQFLQYFLVDLINIRKFAQVVPLVKFRFIVFMILNQSIAEQYNQKIRSSARTLSQSLLPIIKNGWRSLSKLTFNKLVYLYELTSTLKKVDKKVFLLPPDTMLRSLKDIETAYLILSSDTSFISSLQNELEHYFKVVKNQEFPVDFLIRNIATLLSTNSRVTNLNTFLQTLNIVTYRRFLSMEMLVNSQSGPYFYSGGFELDSETQNILFEYTQSIIGTIKQNVEIYQDVNLFRQFVTLRLGYEKNNLTMIEKFYDEVQSTKLNESIGSNRFIHDYNNVIAFMIHFSLKVEVAFKNILVNGFSLGKENTDKKVRLFDPSLFSNYLKRAAYIRSKLDVISNDTPVLRREFYISAVSEGRLMNESAELVSFISELTAIYFQMAKILASILHYSHSVPKSDSLPAIHLIDFKNTRFFLPYSDYLQYSSNYISGQTVRDALTHITELFFVFCMDFRETQFMSIIAKEKNATQTLRQLIKELERISTAEDFQEFKKDLKIDSLQLGHLS